MDIDKMVGNVNKTCLSGKLNDFLRHRKGAPFCFPGLIELNHFLLCFLMNLHFIHKYKPYFPLKNCIRPFF